MKQFWISESKCTGCGACLNACPKSAISMKKAVNGFFYPLVAETCVDCNLCSEVCGRRTTETVGSYKQQVFAAWTKNDETRFQSTSGGVFSELATSVLNGGGYVVGARYDQRNYVRHYIIHNTNQLSIIRQSKYVQSDTEDVFRKIRTLLIENKTVAFCGTPCQVAGLKAYLGKVYENLLTIDFICRGVNSPIAFEAWLKELEARHKSSVTKVWFKYKDGGWKTSPTRTRVDFANGEYDVFEEKANLFMQGYFANLYIRPSCFQCEFKGLARYSDLTLGDFWGVDKSIDDDKGISMIMINSSKGEKLFNVIKDRLFWEEKDIQAVSEKNPCLFNSVPSIMHTNRFFKDLKRLSFSKSYERAFKICIGQKLKYLYYQKIKNHMSSR